MDDEKLDKKSKPRKTGIPSKGERQAAFFRAVEQEGLSNEEAVRRAQLIPREIVAQCKVVAWPELEDCAMKTLFLDFDGVLHGLAATEDRKKLFQWAPILAELIRDRPVSLVVHSSWRLDFSIDALRAFLPDSLASRVVGSVRPGSKYFAILEYVQEHGIDIDNYRVLDDGWEDYQIGWPQLIVCDSRLGLSDPSVQRQIREFVGQSWDESET